MRGGHECIVFDLKSDNVKQLASEGAIGVTSLDELAGRLSKPRAMWVMVPAGEPTEQTVLALAQRMEAGDTIIDGGNSYYKDDLRRAKALREGHSLPGGGHERRHLGSGARLLSDDWRRKRDGQAPRSHFQGACARAGRHSSHSRTGTVEEGYLHCGPHGAGHFAKMVHNGIEYGLMQAYAAGFDILRNADSKDLPEDYRYNFNIAEIAEVWRRGSVVGSWLLDLIAMALVENPTLSNYIGFVQDSGEGRWAIMAAIEEAVPADVLSASPYARFRSRQEHTFAEKVLSAARHMMGGHIERPAGA